jgi:hypothetical protein
MVAFRSSMRIGSAQPGDAVGVVDVFPEEIDSGGISRMKGRKSRLVLMGVLTLALALTVGLLSGSVADAKKGKKKGGKVTVSSTAPIAIGPSTPPPPTPPDTVINRSVVSVPLNVGKKAKGKVVSLDSVAVSFTITGSGRTGAGTGNDVPAAASEIGVEIISPNGRAVGGLNPGQGDENAATIGPVTVTPDSPFDVCNTTEIGTNGTTTACQVNDPDQVVRPPTYAGTVGDPSLALLGGVPARGMWIARFRNFSRVTAATINNIGLTIGLQSAPTK